MGIIHARERKSNDVSNAVFEKNARCCVARHLKTIMFGFKSRVLAKHDTTPRNRGCGKLPAGGTMSLPLSTFEVCFEAGPTF